MHVSSPEQINSILSRAKQCISERKVSFHPRRQEMNTLAQFSMKSQDIWHVIGSLTVANYHRGPVTDYGHDDRELWIFCADLDSAAVYIKFWFSDKSGHLIVTSFHVPLAPMRLPYANG